MIKENNWESASKYGDHITYSAVINNEDWIWDQLSDLKDFDNFNSCSYGNIVMAVHYGSKFPERINNINKIKNSCHSI